MGPFTLIRSIAVAITVAVALLSAPFHANAESDDTSPLMFPPLPPLDGPYVAPKKPKYNYAEVLHKSYLFYHAQNRHPSISTDGVAW